MKVLALEKSIGDVAPGAFTAPLLREEAQRIWELFQEGIVREAYFRGDRKEAVLILEARDVRAAQASLDTLPLVEEGLIEFDLVPLVPYDGFNRLFA
jgi:hypothetical protein